MYEYSEDERDRDEAGFLRHVMEVVRADVPERNRWQTAQRKLMEQLEARKKETVVMKILRTTYSTKIGWAASAAALVAAGIALAIGFGAWDRRSALAFADVLEQISTFRPYCCTRTTQYKAKAPYSIRMMRLNSSRRREIRPDGTIFVFDLSQRPNRVLILDVQSHSC